MPEPEPKHDIDAALTALALIEAALDHDSDRAKLLVDEGQDGTAILTYACTFAASLVRNANPRNPKLITGALRAAYLANEVDG